MYAKMRENYIPVSRLKLNKTVGFLCKYLYLRLRLGF